jgi:hypothetical protein
MDKDKIFNLFDEENNPNPSPQEKVETNLQNSFIKVGMFIKLIQNHNVFHRKLKNFLKSEQPKYSDGDVNIKNISEFTVYNRSWGFIKDINPKSEVDLEVIANFDSKMFLSVIKSAIKYFESTEEYERCSFLLEIEKIIRNPNSPYVTSEHKN